VHIVSTVTSADRGGRFVSVAERGSQGIRRLSTVVGAALALFMVIGWVVNVSRDPDTAYLLKLRVFWVGELVLGLVSFLVGAGVVRVAGWVIAGFAADRE